MSTKPVINKSTQLVSPSISSLLGVMQVMPGESEEVYRVGLLATIEELGAQTPLQKRSSSACGGCAVMKRKSAPP